MKTEIIHRKQVTAKAGKGAVNVGKDSVKIWRTKRGRGSFGFFLMESGSPA
jgi:hypothetical protein